jgi:hypothetical protein
MDAWNYLLILALVVYAIIRQTRRHEVVGRSRFKLALIYAGVGLLIGGFNLPRTPWSITFLAISLLLSVVVGIVRGRLTRVWRDDAEGVVYAQGTAVTISLFVGLILAKFALGTVAYLRDISDDGGVGEVLVMIALMVGLQAEIVWRRARPLGARGSRGPARAPAGPPVA